MQSTARAWGGLWHLGGEKRLQRNAIMRGRDAHDYGFTDWVYGPTALAPDEEPAMFVPIALSSARSGDGHRGCARTDGPRGRGRPCVRGRHRRVTDAFQHMAARTPFGRFSCALGRRPPR
ncbi:hypothetical protein [Streptomyces sp. DT203]|uniref:hypothetical protein n=1 Tax=Streptomyces sp. DT203 TaxID=3393424 RepID=UPI003CE8A507